MTAKIARNLAILCVVLSSFACGSVRVAERKQIPFTATQMTVGRVTPRASWIEVTLLSPELNRLFYFPASEECKSLIREGSSVEYRRTGGYGFVEGDGVRCEVSGIGSLRLWRDSYGRPTRGMSAARPRERADFKEFYRDDEVILVRGKFVLASYIRWPRADDTIAVFGNNPLCNKALERGMGLMEFNPNGSYPLVMVQQGGNCAFEALIRPE